MLLLLQFQVGQNFKAAFFVHTDGARVFLLRFQAEQTSRVLVHNVIQKSTADAHATIGLFQIQILDPDTGFTEFCGKAFGDHAIALNDSLFLENVPLQIGTVVDAIFKIGKFRYDTSDDSTVARMEQIFFTMYQGLRTFFIEQLSSSGTGLIPSHFQMR